jgi:predicted component of type VI protein secretion system
MYSSVFVRSASLLSSVPREIKENDNDDDDDEKKTAAAGVVKAYSSKTNSQWERIYTYTCIDEHWVADCPITLKTAATFL